MPRPSRDAKARWSDQRVALSFWEAVLRLSLAKSSYDAKEYDETASLAKPPPVLEFDKKRYMSLAFWFFLSLGQCTLDADARGVCVTKRYCFGRGTGLVLLTGFDGTAVVRTGRSSLLPEGHAMKGLAGAQAECCPVPQPSPHEGGQSLQKCCHCQRRRR